jgi:hypothetical protein
MVFNTREHILAPYFTPSPNFCQNVSAFTKILFQYAQLAQLISLPNTPSGQCVGPLPFFPNIDRSYPVGAYIGGQIVVCGSEWGG